MRNSATIMTSPERHQQLKDISAALKHRTLSETIAYLVRAEISAGTIPANLLGVAIERAEDGIRIVMDDSPPAILSLAAARDLATAIERAASGKPLSTLDLDADFAVERRGTSVKVTVPLAGEARAFSYDVAEDLAGLIRTAAE